MFKAIESRSDDSLSFGEFVEVSVYICSVLCGKCSVRIGILLIIVLHWQMSTYGSICYYISDLQSM